MNIEPLTVKITAEDLGIAHHLEYLAFFATYSIERLGVNKDRIDFAYKATTGKEVPSFE